MSIAEVAPMEARSRPVGLCSGSRPRMHAISAGPPDNMGWDGKVSHHRAMVLLEKTGCLDPVPSVKVPRPANLLT